MTIVPYRQENHDQLVDIWLRAVQATHHFLTEEDITFFHQIVRDEALTSPGLELWIALDTAENPLGFMGLVDVEVTMLFIDPLRHGQGIGTQLLDYAVTRKGSLTVDVNEQNPQAVTFYKRYGFEQVGRSEVDSSGKPFPLLHLRLSKSTLAMKGL